MYYKMIVNYIFEGLSSDEGQALNEHPELQEFSTIEEMIENIAKHQLCNWNGYWNAFITPDKVLVVEYREPYGLKDGIQFVIFPSAPMNHQSVVDSIGNEVGYEGLEV